ncbi:MAG: glycosyltransferase family 4 protein [Acidobacteriia bacterium]|jgi:glycosyltransferase involved in cell wall biosynthesis|nr:glycosyltransferase family 4 protein [Terriglobia bacterium]
MRVVCPIIDGSGVEIYHQRLSLALSCLGVRTDILKFSPGWEYFPWLLPVAFHSSKLVKSDLIHSNIDYGSLFQIRGRPRIFTLHHSSIDEKHLSALPFPVRIHHRYVLKPLVKQAIDQADKLVAVSNYSRTVICELFQKDLPIQVIYNGVDAERFHPIKQQEKKGPLTLFFSGNPTYRKGVDLFEPVMKNLGKDFVLRYTTGLRNHRESMPSGNNIICLGSLTEDELIKEVNQAHIIFQPSRREGFGLSILEAMACGKPVVSTLATAIPEVLTNNKGGILCEPESVDQLVNAIRTLASSRDLREKMGRFNRENVLRHFTLKNMSIQYYHLYRELLDN